MPRAKARSRSQGDIGGDTRLTPAWKEYERAAMACNMRRKSADRFSLDSQKEEAGSPQSSGSEGKIRFSIAQKQNQKDLSKREANQEGAYEGASEKGKRHGKGVLRAKKGAAQFEGQWVDGRRHGYGVSKYDGGSRHEGLYKDNLRHGLGVFLWPNGDKYSGNFTNGNIDGYGRFEWACGNMYVGQWQHGRMEGEGRMHKRDGHVLEGHFVRGEMCGWARKQLPSGDRYTGYVVANCHEGYGEYQWVTGDHFEGQWRRDVVQGTGTLFVTATPARADAPAVSGHVYRGNFVDGKPQGCGEYHYPDEGKRCLGSWTSEGAGWARIHYDNGLVYEGEVQDCERHGQGELRYSLPPGAESLEAPPEALRENGIEAVLQMFGGRLVGTFQRDTPEGAALLILESGQMQELLFRDGAVER